MNQQLDSKYYTTKEAAKLLNMSRGGLIHAIRAGRIPAFRFPGTKKWLVPKDYIDKAPFEQKTVISG